MHFLKRGQRFYYLHWLLSRVLYYFFFLNWRQLIHIFCPLLFAVEPLATFCWLPKYYNKYFSYHFIKIYFCSFIFYLTLKTNEINRGYSNFCSEYYLFHRVKWKKKLSHEIYNFFTNVIYNFFTSQDEIEIEVRFMTKIWIFVLFYIQI